MDAAVLEIFCLLSVKENKPQGRHKSGVFFFSCITVFRFVDLLVLLEKMQKLKKIHIEIGFL